MLTRDDVERIIENVLRELTLEVESGDFYGNRNSRTIKLKLDGRVITEVEIDVTNRESYDD